MSEFKEKIISGFSWGLIDTISYQIMQFGIGIILARLLMPPDFGQIGMISLFIAIPNAFIDSGFSTGLIQKQNCSPNNYSTIFYFNLLSSIFFYTIIFIISPFVADFFNTPILIDMLRILGLVLIIGSLSIIQRTIFVKNINFRLQFYISLLSNLISGIIAIYSALKGYGVWSLVYRQISNSLFISIFLWLFSTWRPKWVFEVKFLKEMLPFSSKILATGLLNSFFENIYYPVIGRIFNAEILGYYTRAYSYSGIPANTINGVYQKVSYPILSSIQDNSIELRRVVQKFIVTSMFLNMFLLILLMITAKPLIIILIGKKWLPSLVYLQLLCIYFVLHPLHSINLNILLVKARADLGLRLEIIKKILVIPALILGIFLNLRFMIIGMVLLSVVSFYLNSKYSLKLINYGIRNQLNDIFPSFLILSIIGTFVHYFSNWITSDNFVLLIIQIFMFFLVVIFVCEVFKLGPYNDLKSIFINKFFKSESKKFI